MLRKYSTPRVFANRKTRIKRAKNRMLLRIKEIVRVKKSHVRARLLDISLIRMYEVVLTDMSGFFFQECMQQLMILRQNGWSSRASKTLQMKRSLQVRNGNKLPV